MEQTSNGQDSGPEIKFNIDDFDLENYEFEPITKGLGFNREIKNETLRVDKKIVQTKADSSLELEKKHFESAKKAADKQVARQLSGPTASLRKDALASFYSDRPQTSIGRPVVRSHEQNNIEKTPKLITSPLIYSFGAWILDFLCINAAFVLTLSACVFLAELPRTLYYFQNLNPLVYYYLALLYSCYYIFYFTIFDLNNTIGKSIFGIRAFNLDGGRINFRQSLVRSAVNFFSLFLLGLPLLIDFQGKLSDTQVCID